VPQRIWLRTEPGGPGSARPRSLRSRPPDGKAWPCQAKPTPPCWSNASPANFSISIARSRTPTSSSPRVSGNTRGRTSSNRCPGWAPDWVLSSSSILAVIWRLSPARAVWPPTPAWCRSLAIRAGCRAICTGRNATTGACAGCSSWLLCRVCATRTGHRGGSTTENAANGSFIPRLCWRWPVVWLMCCGRCCATVVNSLSTARFQSLLRLDTVIESPFCHQLGAAEERDRAAVLVAHGGVPHLGAPARVHGGGGGGDSARAGGAEVVALEFDGGEGGVGGDGQPGADTAHGVGQGDDGGGVQIAVGRQQAFVHGEFADHALGFGRDHPHAQIAGQAPVEHAG